MARNVDDAIKEEEEFEAEDADEVKEEENEQVDYDDDAGENIVPKVGMGTAVLEFACRKCGLRKPAAGKEARMPRHCGREMALVEKESLGKVAKKQIAKAKLAGKVAKKPAAKAKPAGKAAKRVSKRKPVRKRR